MQFSVQTVYFNLKLVANNMFKSARVVLFEDKENTAPIMEQVPMELVMPEVDGKTKRDAEKRIDLRPLVCDRCELEMEWVPFAGPSWWPNGLECKLVPAKEVVVIAEKRRKMHHQPLRERQRSASPQPRSSSSSTIYVPFKREQVVVNADGEMYYEPVEEPMEVDDYISSTSSLKDDEEDPSMEEPAAPVPCEIVGNVRRCRRTYYEMLWSNGAITMGDAKTCERLMPGQLGLWHNVVWRSAVLRIELMLRQQAQLSLVKRTKM